MGFEAVGRVLAANVFGEMVRAPNLPQNSNIFDFGAGCGRVIKPLYELCRDAHIGSDGFHWFGSDIDAETIGWSQRFLRPIGSFVVNDLEPPLPFENQFFDFVYSISIFTHLPEDMQLRWLEELSRVTKPDGIVVLSVHGIGLFTETRNKRKSSTRRGFTTQKALERKGSLSSIRRVYHTEEYIYNNWGKDFTYSKNLPPRNCEPSGLGPVPA